MSASAPFPRRLPSVRRSLVLGIAMLLPILPLLAFVQFVELQRRFEEDLKVQAQIVADNASATVVFENRSEALEILKALRSAPAIEQAQLLKPNGQVLANYQRGEGPMGALDDWAGQQTLEVPVRAQRESVGLLRVQASRSGVWMDLLRFVLTASGMVAAGLLLALLATRRLRAEVRAAAKRTAFLAHFDSLTQLPNRESFRQSLEEAAASGQEAAVLVINIDNFKQINETHSHEIGDQLLCEVAQRLSALVRSTDLCARLAGDEFAILLRAPADEGHVRNVAAQVVALLPVPVGEWLPTHVSVGIALLPAHADNASAALRCADVALALAKQTGKDGFQVYSPGLGAAQEARARLEQDLRAALSDQHLRLVYQPLFDASGRMVSVEALARWAHPQRGAVSPAEFIPLAEASGLIVELGLHTLELLARDLEQWRQLGLAPVPVAFNLSSRQCRQPRQRQRLLDTLTRLGLQPEVLEFELTEGTLFEDLEAPDSMVTLLQQHGYTLSIDDFGTGYSSLSYLRRLRCRKLKIDRVFIHGLARSPDARVLVEAIVRVAHALEMQVVAEGVEARADWDCLNALHCDLYQGFGLSRPLEPSALATLLQAQAEGARAQIPPR
ncbi:putative bifunctional diguanylate cyclase/phosphodiesterase [Inhella gelatinilytica]|uniref:EAL domain-containing protein n=1 Tax=Inhella gelatinilytica TaxID=2795030 RepID=A0A931IW47_9BURK|nr:EAL domain-containing protein [Inhella gelatinilytica]MBH9552104.1 EAL domain-containing protein [Inhella gelatinilytica]